MHRSTTSPPTGPARKASADPGRCRIRESFEELGVLLARMRMAGLPMRRTSRHWTAISR
jgi:hypothetical protein